VYVGSSLGEASDTGEDLVCRLGPDVGLGIVVVGVEVLLDGVGQLADAACACTDGIRSPIPNESGQ
jgi:hypothetical protein